MTFCDLNDDVKSIIAKHVLSDYKFSTMITSKQIKIYKKYYSVRLYLITIFIKLKKYMMM
jgi:hypothetical protein